MIETLLSIRQQILQNCEAELFRRSKYLAKSIYMLGPKIKQLSEKETNQFQQVLITVQQIICHKKTESITFSGKKSIEVALSHLSQICRNSKEYSCSGSYQISNQKTKITYGYNRSKCSNSGSRYIKNRLQYEADLFEYGSSESFQEDTINQFMRDLGTGKEKMCGNSCVMCLEFVREGTHLKGLNKSRCPCVGLVGKEIFDKDLLQKLICSLANEGFGVIFSSVSSQIQSKIVGYKFTESKKEFILKMINCIRKRISPTLTIQADFIPVYDHLSHTNAYIPKGVDKFCLRIAVFSQHINRLHYLKVCNVGHQPKIQFYQLENHKPAEVTQEKLHSCIIKNYQKSPWTLHYNSLFCKPPFQGQFLNDSSDEEILKGVFMENKLNSFLPKFQYANSSLMIVASEKKTIFVHKFIQTLQKQKKQFSLQKVFTPIAKNCGRKIYFLSHQDKSDNIRALLNKHDKGKNIRFISMEKCLRIPSNKINQEHRKQFRQMYESVFAEESDKYRCYCLDAEMSNGKIEECLFYEFNDYSCAILGYIILQVLTIKPFILKYVPNKGNIKKNIICAKQ